MTDETREQIKMDADYEAGRKAGIEEAIKDVLQRIHDNADMLLDQRKWDSNAYLTTVKIIEEFETEIKK